MIKKMRPRYYCEFCKKVSGSPYHMKRHEESCTNNPNRVCKMCAIHPDLIQVPFNELLDILRKEPRTVSEKYHDEHFIESIDSLRDKIATKPTIPCPACILAAIKALKREVEGKECVVLHVKGFDYKKEVSGFWEQVNEIEHDRTCYH